MLGNTQHGETVEWKFDTEMSRPTLTSFQLKVQEVVTKGKSALLVAPTGLGKTLAVAADVQDKFTKTIYAVPLRALGVGIRDAISALMRNGKQIEAKIHHGDTQESLLFSEEFIVTTYDQVVCGVPGLPLSLPLKAGHAVAGALLMSRLILDEAHLAWGISDQALNILLGIIDFRAKLGLQTVLLTATLPQAVADRIASKSGMELMIVGAGELADDEGLRLRNSNRQVEIKGLKLNSGKASGTTLDWGKLDKQLRAGDRKRIYFANTVDRIQQTFDRLIQAGVNPDCITVLHNRMPWSERTLAENEADSRFGKTSSEGDWVLLTNQVAEAGLDISAPLVLSDLAPVDTLVQRAGRCARWFRHGTTKGEFYVVDGSNDEGRKQLVGPYRADLVDATRKNMPSGPLTWKTECQWVNNAWGGDPEKALDRVDRALREIDFALNLFDRAAQRHRPGEIAAVFREILSLEVAVQDPAAPRDLQQLLNDGNRPETSSISFGRAWQLLRDSKGAAKVIRYDEGNLTAEPAEYVQLGDVIVVPATTAYLHLKKGLCFGDATGVADAMRASNWITPSRRELLPREGGRRQTLDDHVRGVIRRTAARLSQDGAYTATLKKILKALEPERNSEQLSAVIAQLATLGAAFHDLGKTDRRWQEKARTIDPEFGNGLIGRTARTDTRIGIPHTPPGYSAAIKAAELVLGSLGSSEYLIRAIALAAARHHSSFLNPALVNYQYEAHADALRFVQAMLSELDVAEAVKGHANAILEAAAVRPAPEAVPLLLPNDDLFPVYALVGRAILMSDREDSSGQELEQWKAQL
jgi:CRISPR-associated endonuclease/helicase Cas3